jgi:hypothetical protein
VTIVANVHTSVQDHRAPLPNECHQIKSNQIKTKFAGVHSISARQLVVCLYFIIIIEKIENMEMFSICTWCSYLPLQGEGG